MAFFFLLKSFLRQASREVLWLSSFFQNRSCGKQAGRAVRRGRAGRAGQTGQRGGGSKQTKKKARGAKGGAGGRKGEHPKVCLLGAQKPQPHPGSRAWGLGYLPYRGTSTGVEENLFG